MSPYLFTLVMEILTLMLKRNVLESSNIKFHSKCDKIKILNLCFADDLFMFGYGNVSSVEVLMRSLDQFKMVSVQSIFLLFVKA